MATIKQHRKRDFREYETLPDGLRSVYKLGSSYRSFKVAYEDIMFEETVSGEGATPQDILLFVSLIANVGLGLLCGLLFFNFATWALAVAGLFGFIAAVGFFFLGRYLFRNRREKTLEGSEYITFFYAPDQEREVDEFIAALKKDRLQYFHRKYLKIDNLLPLEEQKAKVDWLYEHEEIERRVYQVYLEEYEHLRLLRGN